VRSKLKVKSKTYIGPVRRKGEHEIVRRLPGIASLTFWKGHHIGEEVR
jgi:hypothetical protein